MGASFQQVRNKDDEWMLLIFEGPKVGVDPDIAAEVVRALVKESRKQGDSDRFHILSVTLARNSIALRLRLSPRQIANAHRHLEECKIIFGGIATNTYRHLKGFPSV